MADNSTAKPLYVVPVEFSLSPYAECLIDVSQNVPKAFALEAYGLDATHDWRVDQLAFYSAVKLAERAALLATIAELRTLVKERDRRAANILMWLSEQILDNDQSLSDKISALIAQKFKDKEQSDLQEELKKIGYHESDKETFFSKFGSK